MNERPDSNRYSFDNLDDMLKHIGDKKFSYSIWIGREYSLGDQIDNLKVINAQRKAGSTDDKVERLAAALLQAHHHPYKLDWETYPPWEKDRWRQIAKAGLDVFSQELAMAESARRLVFEAGQSDVVVEISNEDLVRRLRKHVLSRGTPVLKNGIWALMLEAGRRLAQAYNLKLR